jgi:hypothetical protein
MDTDQQSCQHVLMCVINPVAFPLNNKCQVSMILMKIVTDTSNIS